MTSAKATTIKWCHVVPKLSGEVTLEGHKFRCSVVYEGWVEFGGHKRGVWSVDEGCV